MTAALAVIEELKKRETDWEIFFLGRKYAMEGDRQVSSEYQVITGLSIPFLSLSAGRLHRDISWKMIVGLVRTPLAFVQTLKYIFFYYPKLIISFGGYVAVPVVLAGWFCRVPAVTHEQTQKAGLGNRLIGLFAKRIYVSYKESLSHFDPKKTLWTGLPIRSQLFAPPSNPSFVCDRKRPILYITGGATGAQSLNRLVFPILEKLLSHYTIIHQTGAASNQEAFELKSKLNKDQGEHYLIFSYLPTYDLAWIYKNCALVIGRSGANTVGELAALGKIAVLIPLPWSANHEQQENANLLSSTGSVIVINQSKTDSQQLLEAIIKILNEKQQYQSNAEKLKKTYDRNAAARMVDDLVALVQKTEG